MRAALAAVLLVASVPPAAAADAPVAAPPLAAPLAPAVPTAPAASTTVIAASALLAPAEPPAPDPAAVFGAATPFTESAARRFETVFLIAFPFTAIYSSLLVGAAGLAIEGRGFRLQGPYIAAGIVLPALGAGWIAWRDHQRPPEAAALQSNLSPR